MLNIRDKIDLSDACIGLALNWIERNGKVSQSQFSNLPPEFATLVQFAAGVAGALALEHGTKAGKAEVVKLKKRGSKFARNMAKAAKRAA